MQRKYVIAAAASAAAAVAIRDRFDKTRLTTNKIQIYGHRLAIYQATAVTHTHPQWQTWHDRETKRQGWQTSRKDPKATTFFIHRMIRARLRQKGIKNKLERERGGESECER